MLQPIFNDSHLRGEITQYLSTRDSFNCILVSKQWFNWFIPSVWHTVHFAMFKDKDLLPRLERYSTHIKNIIAPIVFLTGYGSEYTVPLFPQLRSVDIGLYGYHLEQLLSKSNIIDSFKFDTAYMDYRVAKELIQELPLQKSLQYIDLTIRNSWEPMLLPQLLKRCQSCTSFRICLINIQTMERKKEDTINKYRQVGVALGLLQDTKLRELEIGVSNEIQGQSIIPSLLKRCPQLECLKLTDLYLPETLKSIIKHIQDGGSPELTHLHFTFGNNNKAWKKFNTDVEKIMIDLIKILGQHKRTIPDIAEKAAAESLLSTTASAKTNESTGSTRRGLATFVSGYGFHSHLILNELVQYHADVLSTLHLGSISAGSLIEGLNHLKCLQSLKASVRFESKYPSILNTPFECTGMKKIELEFEHNYYNYAYSSQRRDVKHLFQIIGKQRILRELILRFGVKYLEMKEGLLDHLCALKQLRYIEISNFHFPINEFHLEEEEAEFMTTNWPRLIEFKAYTFCMYQGNFPPMGIYYPKFIEALRNKRPHIHIRE